MSTTPHLAQKRIEDAARLAGATEDKLQEEAAEHRRAFEGFYNNLAMYSGATLALSVTFLGYLKNLPGSISVEWLLLGCWICLLVCVIASLFCPYFHTHYLH